MRHGRTKPEDMSLMHVADAADEAFELLRREDARCCATGDGHLLDVGPWKTGHGRINSPAPFVRICKGVSNAARIQR